MSAITTNQSPASASSPSSAMMVASHAASPVESPVSMRDSPLDFKESESMPPLFAIQTVGIGAGMRSRQAVDTSIERVAATLKEWRAVVMERLGETRGLRNADLLAKDMQLVDNYRELVFYISAGLESISTRNGRTPNGELTIKYLLDMTGRVQAIALARINREEGLLYLSNIITAPWNLKMGSPIPAEYQSFRTEGAGTTLMTSLFRLAQRESLRRFALKPLDGSYGFYKDKLGMEETPENECFYAVTAAVPEGLVRHSKRYIEE